uniref:Cyclic nucleotide-binding domain-containing protein n=1 Tax=Chromera velia CCMP2878 TaxID=1169474 RepID=A0A0G4G8L0_9ALVE|eukprot:Cvel_20754.t1-p1 / transcript=Cvel_20754.t1 / gene=Cvel_20754 / organism=Chromera_velia_CCMP2878 / gene_product=Potassium voltage-gated channel subfamily H member, putative / transcript_product=Potassium voltage-gated channel subfamily H member, putative / location=Cvel_scaffold1891:25248-29466(-) / protein_length=826 / sequence_SO=supercontig / SO=protein_coding / is_pseudo=false
MMTGAGVKRPDPPWHLKTYLEVPRSTEERQELADPAFTPFFGRVWHVLLLLIVGFYFNIVPFHIGIPNQCKGALLAIEFATDLILLVDLGLRLVVRQCDQIRESGALFPNDFRTVGSTIQNLPSNFPVLLIALASGQDPNALWVRIVRVVKIFRSREIYVELNRKPTSHTVVVLSRTFRLVLLLWIISLWAGCLLLAISRALSDGWIDSYEGGIRQTDTSYELMTAVLMAQGALTGAQFGNIFPVNYPFEILFCIAIMLVGVFVYSTIFAVFGSTIQNIHSQQYLRRNYVEALTHYMKSRRLPKKHCEQILEYYERYDPSYGVMMDQTFFGLPISVQLAVASLRYSVMFKTVPLFRFCDNVLLRELAVRVRQRVYLPGHAMVTQGSLVQDFVWISDGVASVMREETGTEIMRLTENHWFGERALIWPSKARVTLVAVTPCKCAMVLQEDWADVFKGFPPPEEIFAPLLGPQEENALVCNNLSVPEDAAEDDMESGTVFSDVLSSQVRGSNRGSHSRPTTSEGASLHHHTQKDWRPSAYTYKRVSASSQGSVHDVYAGSSADEREGDVDGDGDDEDEFEGERIKLYADDEMSEHHGHHGSILGAVSGRRSTVAEVARMKAVMDNFEKEAADVHKGLIKQKTKKMGGGPVSLLKKKTTRGLGGDGDQLGKSKSQAHSLFRQGTESHRPSVEVEESGLLTENKNVSTLLPRGGDSASSSSCAKVSPSPLSVCPEELEVVLPLKGEGREKGEGDAKERHISSRQVEEPVVFAGREENSGGGAAASSFSSPSAAFPGTEQADLPGTVSDEIEREGDGHSPRFPGASPKLNQ